MKCTGNLKVKKKSKIRNRYNPAPHLTWDTTATFSLCFFLLTKWNNLSLDVRNSDSIIIFKRKLDSDIKSITRYFYAGNRRAQVLHTRLCPKCSSLNDDLFQKRINDSKIWSLLFALSILPCTESTAYSWNLPAHSSYATNSLIWKSFTVFAHKYTHFWSSSQLYNWPEAFLIITLKYTLFKTLDLQNLKHDSNSSLQPAP